MIESANQPPISKICFDLQSSLARQLDQLETTEEKLASSNLAVFEKDLFGKLRALFKRIHEMLYDLEAQKQREIESILHKIYGLKIRIEDFNYLKGVGQIYKTNLDEHIENGNFFSIVNEFEKKVQNYLKEVDSLNSKT